MSIINVDATKQTELTPEQIKFFNEKGFLVIRNALCKEVHGICGQLVVITILTLM